jgi:hypothetical protein
MTAKEISEWKRLRRLWMRGVATINQINRARALSRKAQNRDGRTLDKYKSTS